MFARPIPTLVAAGMLVAAVSTGVASDRGPSEPGLNASLKRVVPQLEDSVLDAAVTSVTCARAAGELTESSASLLAIIDFSRPSTEERLWVIDLATQEVLFHEHVSHGQGTGGLEAQRFSNTPNSHQSSLGLFRTAETYHGKHGYSLRLDGLESGVNDRARERAIVIHGAHYASESFIDEHGWLGRSWGCPAVDSAVSQRLIDTLKDGAAVFAYYPDETWLSQSVYLSCTP
ncbi:MAG: murein L,D-transpeptidase catalytic domain family protein [Deltaproteobacteria bacterium]|nr:MAG: murein L,D-transpeptidase catalytic domain family protein [Deltaproteobacteria bacterium]